MTRWQRRLRLGLGLFVLALAAALLFSLRRPPAPPATPPVARAQDPDAVAEFARGRLTQAKGTSEEYELRYERLVTYKDGRSRLEGVTASVPERDGRSFTISGRQAEVKGQDEDVDLRGNVEFRSSDGLVLLAEQAFYNSKSGAVRVPGPARFSRGRLSGRSVGLTYNRQADRVGLLASVRLEVEPDEHGAGSGTIESASAVMARADRVVRFDGGTRIVREGQVMSAETAVARLTDDEQRVRRLELRGDSRVAGQKGSASPLDSMAARDIDLVYGEDGVALEQALLRGGSLVVLRAGRSAGSRRLSAEDIEIGLAPDGTTVTSLDGRNAVRLELPGDGEAPARVITSDVLSARGKPGEGLSSASFRRNMTFVETPAGVGATPRRATSARLDLALDGGFDSIRSADFSGRTRFEEGSLVASSAEARYDIEGGRLELLPGRGSAAVRPQVLDEQATIEADAIAVGLDGRKVDAKGSVKSDLRPRPGGGAARGQGARSEPARLPSMMRQDQPVYATSDALAYDGEAGRAVYTGRARLWQADTSIRGDKVTLDDRNGDLAASGGVVSTMLLEQLNEETKQKDKVRSVASGDDLVYDEAERRARYTGNARLNGPQGDLSAPVIEIYLAEGGGEVQRLEAYLPPAGEAGHARAAAAGPATQAPVSIRTPDGRRASGHRLQYTADGERYEMVGTPVRIVEECRETTGKTLTFFRSVDRIVVDGNEQRRTEVKGSGGCSAPRLD